jgi:hypothetical protein
MAYALMERRQREHIIVDKSIAKNESFDVMLVLIMFLFSLAAKMYKVFTGNYISFLIGKDVNMALANIIENTNLLGWTCFVAVWVFFFSNKVISPVHFVLFWIINITQLLYQVVQGSKTFLMLPLFLILISYYHCKRKIPLVGAICAVIFGLLVVFPFVKTYREHFVKVYGHDVPTVWELNPGERVSDAVTDTKAEQIPPEERALESLSRFAGADELYNILVLVPQVLPYKLGEDFLAVFYGLVPRAVWPDKPILSPGADYGRALGAITSITPFPLGQMYWNFGWSGLVFGMALWGVFLALCMDLFDYFCRTHSARFYVMCIYLSEIYWLSTGEGMLPMLLASVPKKIVVYGGIYLLVSSLMLGRSKMRSRQSEVEKTDDRPMKGRKWVR